MVVVGLVGLVGAAVVDFTAVLVGAAAGGLGRGVTGGGTSSDGLAVRGLEAGVAAVVSSIGPSAEAGRGTSVTAAAGGTAVISSGTSGARRVDAHAVVAATTTTATTPNPAQGRSLRTRLGRRTIGTIVVRSSTGSARGTNRVRSSGPSGSGDPWMLGSTPDHRPDRRRHYTQQRPLGRKRESITQPRQLARRSTSGMSGPADAAFAVAARSFTDAAYMST